MSPSDWRTVSYSAFNDVFGLSYFSLEGSVRDIGEDSTEVVLSALTRTTDTGE